MKTAIIIITIFSFFSCKRTYYCNCYNNVDSSFDTYKIKEKFDDAAQKRESINLTDTSYINCSSPR